jgi:hypothetical protein
MLSIVSGLTHITSQLTYTSALSSYQWHVCHLRALLGVEVLRVMVSSDGSFSELNAVKAEVADDPAAVWSLTLPQREEPDRTPTLIVPRLFIGGTPAVDDSDTSREGHGPKVGFSTLVGDFDLVVTVHRTSLPVPFGVDEVRSGFRDWKLSEQEAVLVDSLAQTVASRWEAGDRVLVRCQGGLNRSSLVVARALVLLGLSPAQAVTLIRSRRSADCLNNKSFVRWLLALEGFVPTEQV